MLSMYEILGIDPTTVDVGFNFQPAYDALIDRYHPTNHPDDIQRLGQFLRDGDIQAYDHRNDILENLKKIVVEKEQELPLETLEILSTFLCENTHAEHDEACAELLAYCAVHHQRLPDNVIRILERTLENSEDNILNIAASALSGALDNGQTLAPNILQLTEVALIRQQQDKEDITAFLYQLIKQSKQNELSAETYAQLCNIILEITLNFTYYLDLVNKPSEIDDDEMKKVNQLLNTHEYCCNILATSASQGHAIPGIVFETLISMLQHPEQSIREKAFDVLMTCATEKKNRLNIPSAALIDLITATEQALHENDPVINQYAACIAGYLVQDEREEPDEWLEFCYRLDVKHNPNTLQDLLFDFLVSTLQNYQIRHVAVLPLLHLLGQGKYSLLNESHHALKEMIEDPNSHLDLKKNAIKLMGLSIRNSGNLFSAESDDEESDGVEELKTFAQSLEQKNPELTQSILNALCDHVKNLNTLYVTSPRIQTPVALSEDEENEAVAEPQSVDIANHHSNQAPLLPDYIMTPVFTALKHPETTLDAMQLIKLIIEERDEETTKKLLRKFLVNAEAMILTIARLVFHNDTPNPAHDDFLTQACSLLSIAHRYQSKEATRILDRLEMIRNGKEPKDEYTKENEDKKDLTSGNARSVYQLFDLLKADKRMNKGLLKRFKKGHFRCQLEAIYFSAESGSNILPINKPIKEWDEADCIAWAKFLKSQPDLANDPNMLAEIIAVISRGNKLSSGQQPRDTQLISLLVMLDAKEKGRLAQIATGEGKSTIVAMLAAIKALQGESVDVVSSSPLLAYRDAEEKADFFKLFDLTVGCNWDPDVDDSMSSGFKECYDADIVYGDANQFEFDLLKHEYQKEGTRGKRKFETVIVDEVDSMLIDESSKLASLGSFKPMMSELENLFQSVWIELRRRKHWMTKPDFQFPINQETGEPYTQTEYLTTVLELLILELLEPEDPITKIPKPKVPNHLKDFARSQAPYWAKSAVMASEKYELDGDYVIGKEGGIAPVDYVNTGVTHANSAWDDGLHQFLQIIQGVKFKAENLTASFISNRAYFKRYGKSIFGLTGTLGAKDARTLLKGVYNVDLAFIPTYKEKDFTEIPGELKENAEDWLAEVIAKVSAEAKKGRAVLVICETINKAKKVEKALREKNIHQIKSYTRSDNDDNLALADKVMAGDIIIATNLAGRGTDIKTSDEVEKAGGLYVCLTFLPKNLRIEEQALGRTSRQGQKGSAQLVVNKSEAIQPLLAVDPDHQLGHADSMEDLKTWRDEVETESIELVKRYELPKLIFKDKLFTEFCEFTTSLREIDKSKAKFAEVEEQWGFWLKTTMRRIADEDPVNEAEIEGSLEKFKAEMGRAFILGDLKNSCESVKLGIELGDTEKAVEAYKRAIKNDPDSLAAVQAHYRLAHVYISRQNKEQAIEELEAADDILTTHVIPRFETSAQLPLFYQPQANEKTPDDIKRHHTIVHLLQIQKGYLGQNLTVLRNSLRPGGRAIHTTGTHWLGRFFDENTRPKEEINELVHSGLPCLFEIQEVPPPKKKKKKGLGAWLRRGFVAIVGVCQIAIGVCLTITGNVTWGQFFIDLGVSDIMFAVRSAIEGTECTWAEYRAHKIVSTAVAFATMGIGILREAYTTTPGLANISKQELIRSQIKQAIVRGVILEGLHFGASAIAKGMVADHKEEIENRARGTIIARLNQEGTKQLIDDILMVDLMNGNQEQLNKLLQLANNIIQPKRNSFAAISESIFKGVASNVVPGMELFFKAQDLSRAIDKAVNLCDNFCDDFRARLAGIARQLPKLSEEQKAQLEPHLNSTRAQLYDAIANQVTQAIKGTLRHGIVAPLFNSVFTENIDKKIGNIQDKQLNDEIKSIQQSNETLGDSVNNTISLLTKDVKPSALGTHQEQEFDQLQSLLQQSAPRREETLHKEAVLEARGQTCPFKFHDNEIKQQTGFSAPQMTCLSHSISTQSAQIKQKRREEIRADKTRSSASRNDGVRIRTMNERLESGQSAADAILSMAGNFGFPLMTRIPKTATAANVAPSSSALSALINLPNQTFRVSAPDRVMGKISREVALTRLPLNQTTTDIVRQSAMKPVWQITTPGRSASQGNNEPSLLAQSTKTGGISFLGNIVSLFIPSAEAAVREEQDGRGFDKSSGELPLYRGDDRDPEVIFNEGFVPKGTNRGVYSSPSKEMASTFPAGNDGAFVYEINPQKTGEVFNEGRGVFIPNKINPADIKGAWRTDRHHNVVGDFIENPNYVPPPPDAIQATPHEFLQLKKQEPESFNPSLWSIPKAIPILGAMVVKNLSRYTVDGLIGLAQSIDGSINFLAHPYDNFLQPVGSFIVDGFVVANANAFRAIQINCIHNPDAPHSFCETAWEVYTGADQRMTFRIEHFKGIPERFVNASDSEQRQAAAKLVADFATPLVVLRVFKDLKMALAGDITIRTTAPTVVKPNSSALAPRGGAVMKDVTPSTTVEHVTPGSKVRASKLVPWATPSRPIIEGTFTDVLKTGTSVTKKSSIKSQLPSPSTVSTATQPSAVSARPSTAPVTPSKLTTTIQAAGERLKNIFNPTPKPILFKTRKDHPWLLAMAAAIDIPENITRYLTVPFEKIRLLSITEVRSISNVGKSDAALLYVVLSKKEGLRELRIAHEDMRVATGTYSPWGEIPGAEWHNTRWLLNHHDLAGGEPVLAAGEIFLEWNPVTRRSEIRNINAESGHYHPSDPSVKPVVLEEFKIFDEVNENTFFDIHLPYEPVKVTKPSVVREASTAPPETAPAAEAPIESNKPIKMPIEQSSSVLTTALAMPETQQMINMLKFGVQFEPPQFLPSSPAGQPLKKDTFTPIPKSALLKSAEDLKKLPAGTHELVYVMTPAAELFLYPKKYSFAKKLNLQTPIEPLFDRVEYSELSNSEPLIAVGTCRIRIVKNQDLSTLLVERVDSHPGLYYPEGEHLETVITHIFNQQGIDITHKYDLFYQRTAEGHTLFPYIHIDSDDHYAPLKEIRFFTLEDVRKISSAKYPRISPLLYVVLPNGELRIAQRPLRSSDLAQGKPVIAAGKVFLEWNPVTQHSEIRIINSESDCYHTTGIKQVVLEAFEIFDEVNENTFFDSYLPTEPVKVTKPSVVREAPTVSPDTTSAAEASIESNKPITMPIEQSSSVLTTALAMPETEKMINLMKFGVPFEPLQFSIMSPDGEVLAAETFNPIPESAFLKSVHDLEASPYRQETTDTPLLLPNGDPARSVTTANEPILFPDLFAKLGNPHQPLESIKFLSVKDVRELPIEPRYKKNILIYVILPDGELRITERLWNHADLAQGEAVIAAGEIFYENGIMIKVNLKSGHYKTWGVKEIVLKRLKEEGFYEVDDKLFHDEYELTNQPTIAPQPDYLSLFGMPTRPPEFEMILDGGQLLPGEIFHPIPESELLKSLHDLEQLPEGTHHLLYAIKPDATLLFYPHKYSVADLFFPHKYTVAELLNIERPQNTIFDEVAYPDISHGKPLLAVGDCVVTVNNKTVSVDYLNNRPKHYHTEGEHLETLIPHVFKQHGINVENKYKLYDSSLIDDPDYPANVAHQAESNTSRSVPEVVELDDDAFEMSLEDLADEPIVEVGLDTLPVEKLTVDELQKEPSQSHQHIQYNIIDSSYRMRNLHALVETHGKIIPRKVITDWFSDLKQHQKGDLIWKCFIDIGDGQYKLSDQYVVMQRTAIIRTPEVIVNRALQSIQLLDFNGSMKELGLLVKGILRSVFKAQGVLPDSIEIRQEGSNLFYDIIFFPVRLTEDTENKTYRINFPSTRQVGATYYLNQAKTFEAGGKWETGALLRQLYYDYNEHGPQETPIHVQQQAIKKCILEYDFLRDWFHVSYGDSDYKGVKIASFVQERTPPEPVHAGSTQSDLLTPDSPSALLAKDVRAEQSNVAHQNPSLVEDLKLIQERQNLERFGVSFEPLKFPYVPPENYPRKAPIPIFIPSECLLTSAEQFAYLPMVGRHKFLYVLTEEGDLLMYPERYDSAANFNLPPVPIPENALVRMVLTSEISHEKPIVAAGHLVILKSEDGFTIEYIDNFPPNFYETQGENSGPMVEHAFIRHGFDAAGKYKAYSAAETFDEIFTKLPLRGQLRSIGLPWDTPGNINFIPSDASYIEKHVLRGFDGSYLDKFGNPWNKRYLGDANTAFEWDVKIPSQENTCLTVSPFGTLIKAVGMTEESLASLIASPDDFFAKNEMVDSSKGLNATSEEANFDNLDDKLVDEFLSSNPVNTSDAINNMLFGVPFELPKFHFVHPVNFPTMDFPPIPQKSLLNTAEQIAELPLNGRLTFLYVITEEGNLLIYPERHETAAHMYLIHDKIVLDDAGRSYDVARSPDISHKKPIIATGKLVLIKIEDEVNIEYVDDCSPDFYTLRGDHFGKIIEHVLNRHGFDASGKFKPYVPEPLVKPSAELEQQSKYVDDILLQYGVDVSEFHAPPDAEHDFPDDLTSALLAKDVHAEQSNLTPQNPSLAEDLKLIQERQNLERFGVPSEPPTFQLIPDSEAGLDLPDDYLPIPLPCLLTSPEQMVSIPTQGIHTFLYVITEEGKLFLYPHQYISAVHFKLQPPYKPVGYSRDELERHYFDHPEFAHGKRLVGAGEAEIIIIDGSVTVAKINNFAPTFGNPMAADMKTRVEHVFNQHKFDATDKFQPYVYDKNILLKASIRRRLEQAHLPCEARSDTITFELSELYDPDLPIPTVLVEDKMASVDRWGNLWFGGPEWEVHFSPAGKEHFSHLINNAEKMTVSHVGTFKPFEGK